MSRRAELEALERQRALTPLESCELEVLVCRDEGRLLSRGFPREATRVGFRRMRASERNRLDPWGWRL